jgi:hypothetical protein
MTTLFSPSIRNLMAGRGLQVGFAATSAISVYSGVQPTAAQITANWSQYASTNPTFLAHYVGAAWTQPGVGILLQLTVPPAANAINTGTASWCIVWSTNVLAATVGLSTLPSTSFIVGPVSDSVGPGIVRYAFTGFVSGLSTTILDGSIGATLV